MALVAALAAIVGWGLSLGREERIAKYRFQAFVEELSAGLGEFENTQTKRHSTTSDNECGNVGLTFAKPNTNEDVLVNLHVRKGIGDLIPWNAFAIYSYVVPSAEQTCVIEIPKGDILANTAIIATPTANATPELYRWICLGRINDEWRVDRLPYSQDPDQRLTWLLVVAPMRSQNEPVHRNVGYECLQLLLPKLDQQSFLSKQCKRVNR